MWRGLQLVMNPQRSFTQLCSPPGFYSFDARTTLKNSGTSGISYLPSIKLQTGKISVNVVQYLAPFEQNVFLSVKPE